MPETRSEELANLSVIGVDIGKYIFHLVGFDNSGKRVLRLKIGRLALPQVFDKLPRCVVGMEACLSAILSAERCGGSGMSRGSSRRST